MKVERVKVEMDEAEGGWDAYVTVEYKGRRFWRDFRSDGFATVLLDLRKLGEKPELEEVVARAFERGMEWERERVENESEWEERLKWRNRVKERVRDIIERVRTAYSVLMGKS